MLFCFGDIYQAYITWKNNHLKFSPEIGPDLIRDMQWVYAIDFFKEFYFINEWVIESISRPWTLAASPEVCSSMIAHIPSYGADSQIRMREIILVEWDLGIF